MCVREREAEREKDRETERQRENERMRGERERELISTLSEWSLISWLSFRSPESRKVATERIEGGLLGGCDHNGPNDVFPELPNTNLLPLVQS